MLFPTDYFDCVATIEVPVPDVSNICSDTFSLVTEVVDADGNVVATILDGDDRTIVLGLGDYNIVYTVTDSCGTTVSQVCIIRVADLQEPAAICIGHINVSVGGYGIARIYNNVIDLGSYDNCSIDSILVRRYLFEDSTGVVWSDWGPYVDMDCADVGGIVRVQLRVVDGSGNENICETSVSVVDNTLPYCTGLLDIIIGCNELPFDFDPLDSLTLVTLFGAPEVIDNCAADAIELPAIFVGDECSSAGVITRRFLAIDEFGNVSAQEFIQTITIEANEGFTLVFPADTITQCLDEDQGFAILGGSCAELSVTYTDSIITPGIDDTIGCLIVERTYLVINECTYDGFSEPFQVRRDEDCNGIEGEDVSYAIVNGDLTYIDLDTSFLNTFPLAGTKGDDCDGTTNPDGYLRSDTTIGAWTYTQRLILVDTFAPVLIYEDPEPYCTVDGNECEGEINVDITIEGECTQAGGTFLIMVDLDNDGSPEMILNRQDNVLGSFPNFTINTLLPIGDHTLLIRYVDGCNNSSSIMVPVSIVDCSLPEMTCYSGLIVNLEENDTDVNGDGTTDLGIVTVDANQLASCFITDCSGPLSFSVNRIGEVADQDNTSVTLTCDDRYMVELEVYMWDNAFNPFAVQPDSSIGGPNWTFCTVEVFVQDPDLHCPDCATPGSISLAGQLLTPTGAGILAAEVQLTGTLNATTMSTEDGSYRFDAIVEGDYLIAPYKNDDTNNGLSTLDAYILQRHLTGTEVITDPYQLIAADVDNSGTINIIDLLLIRNVVLGNLTEFPNNTSWRFFDASVSMDDLEDVLNTELAETIVLESLTNCQGDIDFIGVKIGDLNGSAQGGSATTVIVEPSTQGMGTRNDRESFPIQVDDRWLEAGQAVELPVRVRDLDQLIGAQFTLQVDNQLATVTEVTPGLLSLNQLGTLRMRGGQISASWNIANEAASAAEQVLFTLTLVPNRAVATSALITLTDAPTATEAYGVGNEIIDLHLAFNSAAAVVAPGVSVPAQSMELMPNYPNPFTDRTTVRFYLPQAMEAKLVVRDLTGRILRTVEGEYTSGYHSIQLNSDDLATGTLYYTLEAGEAQQTRMMINLR